MKRDYWNIFDELEDKQRIVDGVVSLIGTFEESLNYGTSEKEDLLDGIILLKGILKDYNKGARELIEEGFEMVIEERIRNNR